MTDRPEDERRAAERQAEVERLWARIQAEPHVPFTATPEELAAAAVASVQGRQPPYLDPEVLHGGVVHVDLPPPLPGTTWRVEWAAWVDGRATGWRAAAEGLGAGSHLVPDLPPVPQHLVRWRAVPVPTDPAMVDGTKGDGLRCTVCGAASATPQGYHDPDLGPVALCDTHRGRELDWT